MKNKWLPLIILSISIALLAWSYQPLRIEFIQFYYTYLGSEPQFSHDGYLDVKIDSTTSYRFDTEIVDDLVGRQMGLMFRRKMDFNRGMLFVFDEIEPRAFWMKNTYMPLDMLFLDENLEVVQVSKATRLFSTSQVVCRIPSKYVLELNLGVCDSLGITKGSQFSQVALNLN